MQNTLNLSCRLTMVLMQKKLFQRDLANKNWVTCDVIGKYKQGHLSAVGKTRTMVDVLSCR
jgi:hypothetical protein